MGYAGLKPSINLEVALEVAAQLKESVCSFFGLLCQ